MPVTDQTPVNSYTGNAVATTFAYTFKIFENSNLKVTVDGVTKALTTDYSVTGAGQAGGGTVVFVTAPANAAAVVIYRDLTFSRSTDYVEGGDLLAQTVDDDIDRVVMLTQQLKDDKNRALKLAKGETADQVINETAANRANKIIGFDAAGVLALKALADLGGAYSIGDGLQLVGSDLRVASDVVRTASDILKTYAVLADIFSDFVVTGLLGSDPGASLTMTIPGGTAYVTGKRVVKASADADLTRTYTASKDTYVDISNAGAITYSEVANGAAAPAVAANSIRTQKVVTNGTEITGVTDLRLLVPRILRYALATETVAGTDYTANLPALVQGLEVNVKFPTANTAPAPTLNSKKIFKEGGAALAAGDFPAGHHGSLSYDTALDAAAGGWILKNPKGTSAGMQYSDARFKAFSFTRSSRGSAGNVAYTGVGFQPSMVIFIHASTISTTRHSVGVGTAAYSGCLYTHESPSNYYINGSYCIRFTENSGVHQSASLASLDADGFTLSWAYNPTTSDFNMDIIAIAIR